jgi:hypothetical protein
VRYSTVQPIAVQSSPLFQGERWSTDERSHLDRQSPLSVRTGTAYVTHESVNCYDLKLSIASVINRLMGKMDIMEIICKEYTVQCSTV